MQGTQNLLLKKITTNITSDSVITITDITDTQIIFDIGCTLQLKSKKKKPYKIKYETIKIFEHIIHIINSYPRRKIIFNHQNIYMFIQKLQSIQWNQVIVSSDINVEDLVQLHNIKSQRYSIMANLYVEEIAKIYFKLHMSHKNRNCKIFQVEFNLKTQNLIDTVVIIKDWVQLSKCNCDLEKLTIYHQKQLIISMQKKKLYGISICLHKHSENVKLCLMILQLFIKYEAFVSIQFLDWEPHNSEPVNFVFQNYHHRSKYLVKLGNNIQITELRLFINTIGMRKSEVAHIFELMKQPGHYQLICHSNKEFFEEAIAIFLYKPLIEFKYFVPLAQAQQLQHPIEIMMQKAHLLRKKVQVFMNMLKSPYNMDLSTIIKLFFTMSKMTPS